MNRIIERIMRWLFRNSFDSISIRHTIQEVEVVSSSLEPEEIIMRHKEKMQHELIRELLSRGFVDFERCKNEQLSREELTMSIKLLRRHGLLKSL